MQDVDNAEELQPRSGAGWWPWRGHAHLGRRRVVADVPLDHDVLCSDFLYPLLDFVHLLGRRPAKVVQDQLCAVLGSSCDSVRPLSIGLSKPTDRGRAPDTRRRAGDDDRLPN